MLSVLSWNINDKCWSHMSPPDWTLQRQHTAIVDEIMRYNPDVAVMQVRAYRRPKLLAIASTNVGSLVDQRTFLPATGQLPAHMLPH